MKSEPVKISLSTAWEDIIKQKRMEIRKVVEPLLLECDENEVLHFFTSEQNLEVYQRWIAGDTPRISFRLPGDCIQKLKSLGTKSRASYSMIILYLLNRCASKVNQERALEDELWSLVQTELIRMDEPIKRLRTFQKELAVLNEEKGETMALYELASLVNTYEDLVQEASNE